MTKPLRAAGALLIAGLVLAFAAGTADSEGIIALGVPQDIATDGVAIGVAVRETVEEAQGEAMSQCKAAGAKESTVALCSVAGSFTDRCVSVAYNPAEGTPGFGWGIADDKASADALAVQNCETADGKKGLCITGGSACDGKAIP